MDFTYDRRLSDFVSGLLARAGRVKYGEENETLNDFKEVHHSMNCGTALLTTLLICSLTFAEDNVPIPTLEKDEVYLAYGSDQEVGERSQRDTVEFDYEAIYIVPLDVLKTNPQAMHENSTRVSPLGGCRHPVWTKQGDKLAYINFHHRFRKPSSIEIIDFNNKTRTLLETSIPTSEELSWNAEGNKLTYGARDIGICVYDLTTQKETVVHRDPKAQSISMSPDGTKVVFMTRDGTEVNDSDGWRLNIFDLPTQSHYVHGSVDDQQGLHGPFTWTKDSQRVTATTFDLDGQDRQSIQMQYYWVGEKKFTELEAPKMGPPQDLAVQPMRFWNRTEGE